MNENNYKIAAQRFAGNWKESSNFVWSRRNELENPDNWGLYYTHHRDSKLLDQSNAHSIEQMINEKFPNSDNILSEYHIHWAVGWIEGYAIKAFDENGNVTDEFKLIQDIKDKLDEYPILDEEYYYNLEWDATLWGIKDSLHWVCWDNDIDEDTINLESLIDFLEKNYPGELESKDDDGGYPSKESILAYLKENKLIEPMPE